MDKKPVTPIVPKSTSANSNATGDEAAKPHKSLRRELAELGFIALVLVPLINLFVLQSYAIPTPSMESSLLVGDKLFVSKLHYGPRLPQTPLALPYVHNEIFGKPSYIEALQLPYKRIPGLSSVKRGDVVVFNYPGDYVNKIPVDKRMNYVKRCVAEAGDTIKIVDSQIFINSQALKLEKADLQHEYDIRLKANFGSQEAIMEFMRKVKPLGFDMNDLNNLMSNGKIHLTESAAQKLANNANIESITLSKQPYIHPTKKVWTNCLSFGMWTISDHYTYPKRAIKLNWIRSIIRYTNCPYANMKAIAPLLGKTAKLT